MYKSLKIQTKPGRYSKANRNAYDKEKAPLKIFD